MKTKGDKSYRLRNYCTFFVQFLHRSSFFTGIYQTQKTAQKNYKNLATKLQK